MIMLFGIPTILEAPLFGLILLIFPAAKPDLKDAPWEDTNFITGIWYGWITFNAWLMQSDAFFWTQIFTWGKSDLRDF